MLVVEFLMRSITLNSLRISTQKLLLLTARCKLYNSVLCLFKSVISIIIVIT